MSSVIRHKLKSGLLFGLLGLSMVVSPVLPLFSEKAAAADNGFTIKAIDYATLQVSFTHTGNGLESQQGTYKLSGEDFNDSELFGIGNNGGQRLFYTLNGADHNDSCVPRINLGADKNTGVPHDKEAEVVLKKRDPNGGSRCGEQKWEDITIENIDAAKKIMFYWVDEGTIEPAGFLPYNTDSNVSDEERIKLASDFPNLKKAAGGKYSDSYTSPSCPSFVDNISADKKTGRFHMFNQSGSGTCDDDYNIVLDIIIGKTENTKIPAGQGQSTNTNGDELANREDRRCEAALSEGFAWIYCQLIRGAEKAISFLDTKLVSQLKIDLTSEDYADGGGFYAVWSVMRYLSMGLLVIAGLIMVISQAFSFGIFDAYTVKKVLPRMIAAVILISISWPLCKLAIDIVNSIGFGIRGLIYAPFGGTDTIENIRNTVSGGGEQAVATLGLSIGTFFVIATVGGLAVLAMIGTALIALVIALLIIVFRKILIMVLVITAPLAFAAFILPGTEKYWKLWRETLSKTLMMFPLIMALLGVGRVFAYVAGKREGQDMIDQIIIFVAYFGPYFLIPAMFKLAGGVIATIAGISNDRSKGAFDRLKNVRQKQYSQNWQKTKAGSRFSENHVLGRGFNQLGARGATGVRGRFGFGERGKSALDLRTRNAGVEAMKNPMMQQLQFNDDAILAQGLAAGSEQRAREALAGLGWGDDKIKKAVAQASVIGWSKQNSTAALELTARNKSFSLKDGVKGMQAVIAAADALGGVVRNEDGTVKSGNSTLSDNIMGNFEYHSRNAGRLDLGSHSYENGAVDLDGAWGKATLSQHAQGTTDSLKSFTKQIEDDWASGDANRMESAALKMVEMQSMLPYASAGNQKVIQELSKSFNIDYAKGPVEEQIARKLITPEAPDEAPDTEVREKVNYLRGRARVYDQGDAQRLGMPPGSLGGGSAPPPPPGGEG